MQICLNPTCPNPGDPLNANNPICRQCGTQLLLQQRYRVIRLLGEGGFGKTYEIDDLGTTKVLKVLLVNSPKAVSLFQQEARVLSQLHHPGIPKVEPDGYFTFFPKDSESPLHCLVMEKIEGINLEQWLLQRNNEPLSQGQAIIWLRQLTEILHQVHEQLYFHRDIKPSNIMLRPNGQLALIDFGSAREMTLTYLVKVGGGRDVTGIVSPGYTPMEQANGKAVPQSDFFALGRTFIYLLTGKSPYDVPENSRTGELLWRDYALQVSRPLANLLDHLMAPFAGNRPHNAQMILHCLEAIDLTSHLPELSTQTHEGGSGGKRGRSPSRGGFVGIKKLRTKAAKSKKYLAISCSMLLLGLTLTTLYNYVADNPFLQSSLWVSPEAEDLHSQLISSPIEKVSQQKISRLETPVGNLRGVNAIAISADGQTIASGNQNGTVYLWQMGNGQLKNTLRGHSHGVNSVAISPSGETLASASADNTIKLWDLKTGELVRTLKGHSAWVSSVAFSPDGKTIASSSYDKTIKLWDLNTGEVIRTLKGHSAWIFAVAFSPNGATLGSSSYDNTIKLWDLKTGELRKSLKGDTERILTLAISSDGRTLASGSAEGDIELWDISQGKIRHTLNGHKDWVRSVAFSPDGKTLASGSADYTSKLWNVQTGELLNTFTGHADHVRSVVFSPDGETLVSGSYDNTIKFWRLQK